MNPEIPKSTAPFEGLSETKANGGLFDVKEIEKDPTLIIKQFKHPAAFASPDQRHGFAKSVSDLTKLIEDSRLREFIPKNRVAEGTDENGEKTFYVVADKIDGETLPNRPKLDTAEKNRLVEFVDASLDLFESTYSNPYEGKGFVLEFQKPDNYVRGVNLRDNQGKQIYMVDIFPAFPDTLIDLFNRINDFAENFDIPKDKIKPLLGRLQKIGR